METASDTLPQKNKKDNKYIKALKAAFPETIPILTGFLFLGFTYGVYMNVSGFSVYLPDDHEHGHLRRVGRVRHGEYAAFGL